jgi:N-carbamoyl-L-amino-acid hydrolase
VQTRSPLELVNWTNEEGARFAPAMMGSGVWGGEFDLEETYAATDREGVTVRQGLESLGEIGAAPARSFPIRAALEIHIEQGRVLEAAGRQIGVVTGVQGIRWYDLVISGSACHAGTTPMEERRDPVRLLAALLDAVYALAEDAAPWSRVTFGELRADPGSRNTVPERLTVTIDLRHPEQSQLDAMHARLRAIVADQDSSRASVALNEVWHSPPVVFDAGCVAAVRRSAERLGYPALDIVSGAGHDSVYVSRVAPTAMIFIPCRDGLSHNEVEYASPEDVAAGGDVLLGAVLELDAES